MADHRHVVHRSLSNAVGNDPQSRALGLAANKSGHGNSVGPEPDGVQGVGELLAGGIIRPGACALDDHREPARVRRPRRSGDSLVHRHRVGPGGNHRRQRRANVAESRREPRPISHEVIHRHRAEPARGVGEDPIHPHKFTSVHEFSRLSRSLYHATFKTAKMLRILVCRPLFNGYSAAGVPASRPASYFFTASVAALLSFLM